MELEKLRDNEVCGGERELYQQERVERQTVSDKRRRKEAEK